MINAEKFRKIFKEFATEVWAFPEKDFLTWLNAEYEEPTTKNDLGVDCIKKSDAINIIQDMHGLARADVISDAVNRIITMPSVTPQEPRKGYWLHRPHVYGVTYCSICDFELKIDNTNYCPNCGAKMAESEGEK